MGKGFRKAFRILGLDERKVGGQCNQIFMGIFGSMLHGFLPFSLVSWHGLNHAHSGMDGKATPAHDLNQRLAFHLRLAKNFFNNFFRIRLSVLCCRIQQLTKIVHDLSAFIRVCLRNLLQRGGGVI